MRDALSGKTLLAVLQQLRAGYREGLRQLGRYLERLGLDRGTLIIFDQRDDAPPFTERGRRDPRSVDGREILVLRL